MPREVTSIINLQTERTVDASAPYDVYSLGTPIGGPVGHGFADSFYAMQFSFVSTKLASSHPKSRWSFLVAADLVCFPSSEASGGVVESSPFGVE